MARKRFMATLRELALAALAAGLVSVWFLIFGL